MGASPGSPESSPSEANGVSSSSSYVVPPTERDGATPLHRAAEAGDVEATRRLLDEDADPDAVTRMGGYTPLHLAARAGRAGALRALLDAGADPDAETTTGAVRPLHFAAAAGSADAIRALVEHGAEVDAVETRWRQTPLVFAASAGRREAVDALIELGADVEHATAVVDIPTLQEVHGEARRRRGEVFDSMAEAAGLDEARFRPTPVQVEHAVREANRAAREAEARLEREERRARAARAEVAGGNDGDGGGDDGGARAGARSDTIDYEEAQPQPLSYGERVGKQGGLTPLLHAVREGHTTVAVALLEAGADIDRPSEGDGTPPLLMAMLNGHFDLGLLLLARGADPNGASHAGATPLYAALNTHWAPKARYPQQQAYLQQETGYLDVMGALLDSGADPNARLTKHLWYMGYTFDVLDVNTRGATPFWRAAYATDVEAMKLLVAAGAEPTLATEKPPSRRRGGDDDRPDPSGVPPVPTGGPAVHPIHAASGVGYGEGYAGNAHRHVEDGWLPSVRYLVEEHGADVNARDVNGYTPLHHAAARGDDELILYLVSKGADVTAISRRGQTVADMANGPVQRISPFPETVALLEKLGSDNSHDCRSC